MQRVSLTRKLLGFALCFFLVTPYLLLSQDAYALYDAPRDNVSFNTVTNKCLDGQIPFDPLTANIDYDFEITNTYCITYMAGVGATLYATDLALKGLCKPTNATGQAIAPTEEAKDNMTFPLPYPTPTLANRIVNKVLQCAARGMELSSLSSSCSATLGTAAPVCIEAGKAGVDVAKCCIGLGIFLAAVGASIGALAVIWEMAKSTYSNARICGHNWTSWTQDPTTHLWKKVKGPHRLCLENLFLGANNPGVSGYCIANNAMAISNVSFREYIYGGVEFEDNGDACANPTTWSTQRKLEILGYSSVNQRYYMTGPAEAPVYACYRFLAKPNDDADQSAMRIAYDCCKRRSQEAVCVQNKVDVAGIRAGFEQLGAGINAGLNMTPGLDVSWSSIDSFDHKFCTIGSKCTVDGIVMEAYSSKKIENYGCVKTYSLCPYNHTIGGGTEAKEYDPNDQTIVKNFCQFANHCVKLPILPYIYTTNLDKGYISQACRDMKGDSQNVYGYTAQLLPINTRGFSAPLVQCFKETMENIFLHKAGYSQCINPEEVPNKNNECLSGYIFKKGSDLPGKSFFLKIQDAMQSVIKIALTASIVAFGFAILLAVPSAYITKKVLFNYVLKIGLIMYFAVGDAWQFGFMQGVLGTSGFLADLTFKVDENKPHNKLDGCQFPRFNYADPDTNTKYNHPQYPPTKEYLRIWDTLDCKIAMALGFGPEVSVPNLMLAIVGGFFTGGLGLIFFVGAFIFAFFLISMTIQAMHIFIMSITSVIILLYVSPITITCAFFERTKNIFGGWWKQLLGFTLQPMILFAYLGILVSLLDAVILGSATFEGSTIVVNNQYVVDDYGRVTPKKISCNGDANDDSIYCIFRISDIQTFTGFEVLGLGIPLLGSMNSDKLDTIIRAAIIMFIFSSFMDKMTGFASKLVGGAELKSNWNVSTSKLAGKAYGIASAVQSRGVHALRKHGLNVARKGIEVGKDQMRSISSKGRSVDPIQKEGSDKTESSTAREGASTTANSTAGGSPDASSDSTSGPADSTDSASSSSSTPAAPASGGADAVETSTARAEGPDSTERNQGSDA